MLNLLSAITFFSFTQRSTKMGYDVDQRYQCKGHCGEAQAQVQSYTQHLADFDLCPGGGGGGAFVGGPLTSADVLGFRAQTL